MYGKTIGTLNIYQKTGGVEKLIWTLSGNLGNKWFSGQVAAGKAKTYQVQAVTKSVI